MTTRAAKRILAIAGPTGTGKSDIAMALAARLDGEIISCDSVQVYRRFDIGSAKPTVAERRLVPHHCVDVADWSEPFDAAAFCRLAESAVEDITSRGRLPILCGGTGLYLRALRYGLMPAPPVNPRLRAQLAEEERLVPGSLHARLSLLDPTTACLVPAQNIPHVMRALELCLQTKRPASLLRREHGFKVERLPMLVCCLDRATDALRARLTVRTRAMLDNGWVAEVKHLLAQGVTPDCRPMRAVGYREIAAYVQAPEQVQDLHARIVATTWQYARRQRTWWRRERDVQKIDMDQHEDVVSHLVAAWAAATQPS